MPTPTPIPLIKPANRLFATIDIDTINYRYAADQLPSTYYMTGAGPFLRLRPLHRSGFALFEKPTRIVGLYTGNWDASLSFEDNRDTNANILFAELGEDAPAITQAITVLQQTVATTHAIRAHNENPHRPNLNNSIVYVNAGALEGSIFGGDQLKTNNLYRPMQVVDATTPDSRAHTGHAFATGVAAKKFYDDNYPMLLEQLMQLGQSAQVIKTDLSPRGGTITTPIQTDLEYFAQNAFASRRQQLAFLRTLIMSFV